MSLLRPVKLSDFTPKIKIDLEVGSFRIKTVSSKEELDQVLRLRYQIFHREYRGAWMPRGLDVDSFDFACDHLVIEDHSKGGRLVGTYRLLCSKFVSEFYSAQEFEMQNFLHQPGIKLELGRACVDREYRGGVVMTLLWRGLAAYIKEVGADYLFGCSSVKTVDAHEAARLSLYLRTHGHCLQEFDIRPTRPYQFSAWPADAEIDQQNLDASKELLPTLLSAYIKAGAQIAPLPALDKDFHCVDFLTILKTDRLTAAFDRKYQVKG